MVGCAGVFVPGGVAAGCDDARRHGRDQPPGAVPRLPAPLVRAQDVRHDLGQGGRVGARRRLGVRPL